VHARQHPFEQKFNLGLALTRIDPADALLLERALHGFPPIPPSPSTNTLSLEWVEVITRWEEDLGDRINIFEQSEWVLMAEENPPSPFPLTRRKGSLA
ncbi:MAG: hypothetical protein N2515_04315, partial [Deltaproteobacteria bacterium]|nr:hypothetical protein [Deltaproteobacteria bacterium]